ncbi:MAG: carbohydrate kinase family protein [Nanoarchaeota archaeon]
MPKKFDIITIGSATLDVFAKSESELIKIKTTHNQEELIAYPLGSKILITDLEFQIGGGGTNTALTFANLGLKTGYMGTVGNDENGRNILALMKKNRIDFIGTVIEAKTNYSIILDSIEEDRTILVYRDASDKVDFKQLKLKNLRTKCIYSSSVLEPGFFALEKLSEWTKKNNILFAFNPSNYQAEKGYYYMRKVLKNTDILILNKEEAQKIIGNGEEEYLLKKLREAGPKIVVITDGKNGAHILHEKTIYSALPKKVKVNETTGAGDAFASGFVAGLIMKKDILFAIRLAFNNAESVIQGYGPKYVIPNRKKALELVRKDKRKIRKKRL